MLTAHFIGGLILRRGLLLFLRRGLLQPFSTDCSWWELELSQPIFLFTLQETHSQTCHVDCGIFPFPFFSWLSPPRLMKLPLFYLGQIFGSREWYWLRWEDTIGKKKDYEKSGKGRGKLKQLLIERLGLSSSVSPRHQQVMIPISVQQSVYSPTQVFIWLYCQACQTKQPMQWCYKEGFCGFDKGRVCGGSRKDLGDRMLATLTLLPV